MKEKDSYRNNVDKKRFKYDEDRQALKRYMKISLEHLRIITYSVIALAVLVAAIFLYILTAL